MLKALAVHYYLPFPAGSQSKGEYLAADCDSRGLRKPIISSGLKSGEEIA